MKFTVHAAKATDLASNIRLLNNKLEEAASEIGRIASEIDSEGDEILSEKGYGKNLKEAEMYLRAHYDNIDRIASALDWMVDKAYTYEKDVLKILSDKTVS